MPRVPPESLRIGIDPILDGLPLWEDQQWAAVQVMHDMKDVVKAGVLEALAEALKEQ